MIKSKLTKIFVFLFDGWLKCSQINDSSDDTDEDVTTNNGSSSLQKVRYHLNIYKYQDFYLNIIFTNKLPLVIMLLVVANVEMISIYKKKNKRTS